METRMICQSCGGIIGRDCFNPKECMEITQMQAAHYRDMSEQQHEHYLLLHPKRDVAWKSKSLTIEELLDTLRRNHLTLGRDDSPYWQAEQKIRELIQTMDMIAACAAGCGHQGDAMIEEIKRLAETANG